MIKIIQPGKHVATCPECETKFSFDNVDIIRQKTGPCEEAIYIVCPVCNEIIYKDDWRY